MASFSFGFSPQYSDLKYELEISVTVTYRRKLEDFEISKVEIFNQDSEAYISQSELDPRDQKDLESRINNIPLEALNDALAEYQGGIIDMRKQT